MPRSAKNTPEVVARAQAVVAAVSTVDEIREALAVLLPALLNATIPQTAKVLGISRATVGRYRNTFEQRTLEPSSVRVSNWGGRRHCWMSVEQEKAFLAPWIEKAKTGELVVLSSVREALARHVGQPIKASVLYRMLARHGWRKVAPDTRHPKSDPAKQDAWKKNSRKTWQPS